MKFDRREIDNTGTALDPTAISILLIGNDEEQREAIYQIHKHLRRVILYWIRESAIGLAADEMIDVYQEVLLAVWKAAKEERYDPDKPLLPFLLTLARRKTCDRVRLDIRRKGKQVELLDEVLESLKDTRVGEAWQNVAAQKDGDRMMNIIRRTIAQMPARQRQVASVVQRRFPDVPRVQEIRELIRQETGESITVVAVKRAWQEARDKIRERLVEAGYMRDDTHGEQ